MKIIIFIFSFYFLGLNLMPCNDGETSTHQDVEQLEHQSEHNNHEHQDLCSPFCHCSCCSVTVISNSIKPYELIKIQETSRLTILFIDTIYDEFNYSILHPPQLIS